MARDWESTFRNWASPLSEAEQRRCANAEKAIKNAISASPQLKKRNIRVFAQGSYHNNTNVRQGSDVDIGVVCYDIFFPDYPKDASAKTFGHVDGSYSYGVFKNEVGQALVDYFGASAVSRGNKAFDVRANSYHVDADVAPFFEHRRYSLDGTFLSGVELRPDSGKPSKVVNWPEQHYQNGVGKNTKTGKRYKAMVRILKRLCNEMADKGIAAANPIPSFLNECLVWNVPDNLFGHSLYVSDVHGCLAHLFNHTLSEERCTDLGEVSELKYLFRGLQKWTWQQAHSFLSAAWDYVGFE